MKLTDLSDLFDVTAPGRQCVSKDQEARVMYANSGVGVAIDVTLLVLPITVIFRNMRLSAKMVRVVLVFCVGIFAIITGIVRLAIMTTTDFATDT